MARRTAAQAAQTREDLLGRATQWFAEHGYAEVPLASLAAAAGLTRGALYHHFGNKQGLFEAVVARAMGDLGERIEAAARAASGRGLSERGAWAGIERGCRVFLETAEDDTLRRIILLDGPAVLGFAAWKRLDDEHLRRRLLVGLETVAEQGALADADPEAVSVVLSGAMNELCLWVAHHRHPKQAARRAKRILAATLARFRVE